MGTVNGNRIAERLQAIDKSQSWLADRVGMRQQGINSIIRGEVKRPRMLKEIAFWLRTSQEYLLGETDDPSPNDKLPPEVREAIEQIPGGPLTDDEARYFLDIADLIARSRRGRNDGTQDNGSPRAD